MEQALFGDLCTTMSPMDHRRAGWPVASLVDYATDTEGTPIFSLSPMAMHTRNMKYDPRCSLVVEMPGWRGLASARVTLFGTVRRVPDAQQDMARELFKTKHCEANSSYGTSEFPLYMLTDIRDVYFVGGYGTVKWVSAQDYLTCSADRQGAPPHTKPIHHSLSTQLNPPPPLSLPLLRLLNSSLQPSLSSNPPLKVLKLSS